MIKAYSKLPVEVHAVQWTGENIEEIEEFVGDCCTVVRYIYDKNVYKDCQPDRTYLLFTPSKVITVRLLVITSSAALRVNSIPVSLIFSRRLIRRFDDVKR